ncbi:outer membrane efflux family protein [Wolbachia endosymbiont of Drosophila ananassae]|nr:outer membrane efflux family protein [Wolbachia endosymbiont of Drosophila ananassae]RLT61667.1 outer membrane efflux family protein [Wolbachia endosymbiont of Drosophila ananassae]
MGEVISKAIKNSSKIKSQFYQYKSAEKHYKSSGLAGFLPDINLQYNFDSNFNLDTSEKKLTLRQKLIDGGGTFATFSRSSHLLKAEKMRFQQLKQELALNAVKAYVNVLQKTEILKLREHKERVSLEHLSAMKKRFSLGEVTNAEVLLAKAKFSSSISERVDAEGKLKLVNIAYYHLIGEDADDLSEANDKLPSVPELNECLQLAKTNNLSLKAAVYQKRAAGMEVIAESSKWLPSLNLSASKNFGEDGMKVDKLLENVHVVFTLDVPIFKRGVNAFGVSKAKMDAKKSTYDYYETVKNIEQAVVNAWNNVLTAKAIIKASQEAEKAAALALEGVEQEVNLNLKSTSDLLDTEDALFKARSDLVEAKSNYVISVYNLLFMINSIDL